MASYILRCLASASLALLATSAGAELSFHKTATLVKPDALEHEFFGEEIELEGDLAILGAYRDDTPLGTDAGTAYVLRRNPNDFGQWETLAELSAFDAETYDWFGSAVAISGDTVVVGAYEDDDAGSSSGSAYVFQRDAGGADEWGFVAKLTADDGKANDLFGRRVAISGDTLVIGASVAPGEQGPGAAYIFERDAGGPDAWGQIARLAPADDDPEHHFGTGVAVSADTIMVRSIASGPGFVGSAYVFERDAGGPDAWGRTAILTLPEPLMMGALALDDDRLAVVANRLVDDELSGFVVLFERRPGDPYAWRPVAQVRSPDVEPGDNFGSGVDLDADTVVVGADFDGSNGAAYVYRREARTGRWRQSARLELSVSDFFGDDVAVSGHRTPSGTIVPGILVGDSIAGHQTGLVHAFEALHIAPRVSVSGACGPGEWTLTASGLTPGSGVQLYIGPERGRSEVPADQTCRGTRLGLADAEPAAAGRADPNGRWELTLSSSCGEFAQVVDETACATTNVIQVP